MAIGNSGATDAPKPARNYVDSILDEARKPFLLYDETQTGMVIFAVPTGNGYKLEARDANKEDPERLTGEVTLDTLESFIAYVDKFKMGGESRIYCKANLTNADVTMVAVLNDHGDVSGYRDHRATYKPLTSPEWKLWTGANGKPMPQVTFALWLENNMRDIATVPDMPSGAEMLKMALDIEITQDAKFRSSVRLQSGGVAFEYVNKDDEATTKRMQVFERFALGIAPFFGGKAYQVTARLRHKLHAGELALWFELIRPDLTVADAVKEEIAKVTEATGVPVLMGALA